MKSLGGQEKTAKCLTVVWVVHFCLLSEFVFDKVQLWLEKLLFFFLLRIVISPEITCLTVLLYLLIASRIVNKCISSKKKP